MTGAVAGATCSPVISSRPPLMAYSSVLARLTRAPKNCICLPTVMADTQQAMAVSSPVTGRIRSSDSYWMLLVSIETWAAKSLNPAGRRADHRTVRLGSGAGPRLYRVCRNRNDDRVTSVRPSLAHPADGLGDPGRVSGEQRVVLRGPQEPHDPQLDDEVVDQLLGPGLGDPALVEIALQVHVEEGRRAAERHRGAVLLLHRGQVAEVEPLDRLLARWRRGRRCRSRSARPCRAARRGREICSASSSRSRMTSSLEGDRSRARFRPAACPRSAGPPRRGRPGGSHR